MNNPAMAARNRDPRIDAYIAKAAPFAKPILTRLRKQVHAACPEAEETLKWRMPAFLYREKILCGMAAFQKHCTFMFWHRELEPGPGRPGKKPSGLERLGRMEKVADLPSEREVAGYIRRAVALADSNTPARPRKPSRPAAPPEIPPDLAAGLSKNRAAAAAFAKFPPGRQKDYIEWLTGAKREETRLHRLETAIEWIAEGKSRNWKYETR
jgi:uncharacterized protein YdeI (YjbR/CyaY-like superfamily)